jgi:hypothetical protein
MELRICTARVSAVVVRSHRAFGFAALIGLSIAAHAAFLTPQEARSHIGEDATVCGIVVSATYAANAPMAPTFLDLGKPYPNQIFTAVIFGNDRSKFGMPENSMREKNVCVTGEIFLYQGNPEIILHDPAQLREK